MPPVAKTRMPAQSRASNAWPLAGHGRGGRVRRLHDGAGQVAAAGLEHAAPLGQRAQLRVAEPDGWPTLHDGNGGRQRPVGADGLFGAVGRLQVERPGEPVRDQR